jgi:HEAT repeat protein
MVKMKYVSALCLLLAACLGSPADDAAPDPFAALAAYDFGGDRAPLNAVDQAIRDAQGDARKLAEVEKKLIAALARPDAGPGARDYICRTLVLIGTPRCVPAVAALLVDERGADTARVALERLPFPAAGDALRAALRRTTGRVRIGIVQSLGERREPASVAALAALMKDADPATVAAAAQALGKIGNTKALSALLRSGDLRSSEVSDGVLRCAEALSGSRAADAEAAYRRVLESAAPAVAREAAFAGYARTAPAEASERLMDLLAAKDPAANELAIRLARRVQVPGLAKAATERLPSLPPDSQLPLVALLADLGDPMSRPAILRLVTGADPALRVAALEALKNFPADAEVVSVLARAAASDVKAEATAAGKSLARVQGDAVDAALLRGAAAGAPGERRACIAAIGERQTPAAERALMSMRTDADPEIRRAALKALEKLATPEAYPEAVAWMTGAADPQEGRDAERLVVKLMERAPNPAEALIAADGKADAGGKERLARCLASRGGEAALAQERTYLKCGQPDVEMAALRALGTWPDAGPLDDLLAIATGAGDERRVHVAVEGSLRLLALDKTRTADAKAGVAGTLLEKAAQPQTRRLVLGALPDFGGTNAIALAGAYTSDPDCGGEAKAAVRRLRQASMGSPILSSSHNGGELRNACDGNPATRWTTGTAIRPGQWLLLDLQATCLVHRVTLDTAGSPNDFPRGYQVFVGDQPESMGAAVLEGQGSAAVTELNLEPARLGRFVKIVQTGSADAWYWSVHELKVDAEVPDEPGS